MEGRMINRRMLQPILPMQKYLRLPRFACGQVATRGRDVPSALRVTAIACSCTCAAGRCGQAGVVLTASARRSWGPPSSLEGV